MTGLNQVFDGWTLKSHTLPDSPDQLGKDVADDKNFKIRVVRKDGVHVVTTTEKFDSDCRDIMYGDVCGVWTKPAS